MKKTITIIIAIALGLFLVPASYSQDAEVFVSLGGGVSIPLSDYAATDFSMEESGFARVGGNFNIYFGYRFNEYFSLAGLLNGCVNRYDYIKVQDEMYRIAAEEYPDTRWVVESKNWGLGGLLVGPVGSVPIVTNRFFFDVRAVGGFLYAYSPAVYITGVEDGEADKTINIEQGSAGTWAVDVGAGFRYNRTRSQYFILFADYMYSEPSFSNVGVSSTEFEFLRADNYSQTISTINISIGIGYIIN
jgi:hypothetical protein